MLDLAQSVTYSNYQGVLSPIIQHYRAMLPPSGAKALNFNWADIITRFVATVVNMVQTLGGTDEKKRDIVVGAAVDFYNQAIEPLLAQSVGRPFIFNTFIAPAIARMIPTVVGGMYDAIAKIVSRVAQTTAQDTSAIPGNTDFVPY